MNYIIDFFESLKFTLNSPNIEFEIPNEQIIVGQDENNFYFKFSTVPAIFRSNLCKEIIFLNEKNYNEKLQKNNSEFTQYFNKKFNEKISIQDYKQSSYKISDFSKSLNETIDTQFYMKFENSLQKSPQLYKIFLKFKLAHTLNDKLPEKLDNTKKVKI